MIDRDARAARRQYLRALPKAELHLHLEGSLRPELLLRLAQRNRLRLPFATPGAFFQRLRFREFRDFANVLLLGVACLRRPEDFFDAVTDLGAMLVAHNVRYAEVTWTPQFYLTRGPSLDEFLSAMNEARAALQSRAGLVLRWIPDIVRSHPGPAARIADWACSPEVRTAGVVAVGLGGPEAGHPASGLREVFERIRATGMPVNPHAGEGGGPDSVRDTLEALAPVRIGHGVRAAEDPELLAELARAGLPLEVCLTSNLRLGLFGSYAEHPLRQLLDAGCVVTLNTDDPVLFQTTLTDEYLKAVDYCGLDFDDVRRSILAALSASYLEPDERLALVAEFGAAFDRLGPQP